MRSSARKRAQCWWSSTPSAAVPRACAGRAGGSGRRVKRPATNILINGQSVLQWRERALFAIEPLAQSAGGADRHRGIEVVQIVAVSVDELSGVANGTADSYCHQRIAGRVTAIALTNRPRHAEVRGAVGHFGELGADTTGSEKCRVNVPPRTGAGEAGEADAGAAVPFGDIAGDVHPHEVKGNSLG